MPLNFYAKQSFNHICIIKAISNKQVTYGPGGALECNLTGRCPFFKNLHNPFGKKFAFRCSVSEFLDYKTIGNNSLLFLKTIAKTIAYCFWTNSHNPFRNFWSIFIPGSGIYAEKWYPEKPHVPYRFIWKCPPGHTVKPFPDGFHWN